MIKCPICGMEFDTQEEHEKHHQEVHGGEVNPTQEDQPENKETEESGGDKAPSG